ncbi:HGxxPAAW family protein [Streptomyces sp. AC555_RSS877]|uniref:HGxxPAAW family protein n=1 Tax=Streptomyces sp. AC555_RSS877 TaxID=2823688 RepID=UPI001C268E34|nr:HGxxPAAW family protein [Streptomyces sp. AC555_RSS877]
MSAHQYDHGHTVAGWTGVGVATVGSAVLGAGVCLVSVPLLAGGFAIVVVSLLVTWALHLAGWGKPSGLRPREEWGMRVRDLSARGGHPGCVGCRMAGRGARRMAGRPAVADLPVPGSAPVPQSSPVSVPASASVSVPAGGEPAPVTVNPGG